MSYLEQAQEALQEQQKARAEQMLQEDLQQILSFDSTVNSIEDIMAHESLMDCIRYMESNPCVRLPDAYKIVNFDRLMRESKGERRDEWDDFVLYCYHLLDDTDKEVIDGTLYRRAQYHMEHNKEIKKQCFHVMV